MKHVGDMWILDDDTLFEKEFQNSGDQFDVGSLDMVFRHVKQYRTAIDGGAHYGSWTRPFARRFEQVIAVEPRDDLHECLEENTESFDNVVLIKAAFGKEKGSVEVGAGPKHHNSGTASVIGPGDTPLITIDSLNLDNVDFIKLDVEGYELFALQGATQTLKQHKPVVHIEDKGHSTLYQVPRGTAGKYLERLGAKLLESYKNRDFVYGWTD